MEQTWFSNPYCLICRQVCHANPSERARFIRCIYNLLNSSSPAVRYEAAGTLVTLSSAPTAIKVCSVTGPCQGITHRLLNPLVSSDACRCSYANFSLLQAAASCYIELIVKESDNNVKLIVLDRLVSLKEVPAHEKVLQVNLTLTSCLSLTLCDITMP